MEVSQKKYAEGKKSRAARADAAAGKADGRANRLEGICLEQITAWEKNLEQLRADRTCRESAWNARRLILESRALEVTALATDKVEEARMKAGVSAPAGKTPSPPAPTINLQLADATAEIIKVKKEAATAAEQAWLELKTLTQRITALEPSASAAVTPAMLSPCIQAAWSKKIRYTPKDMVPLSRKVEGDEAALITTLPANAQVWTQYGLVPIMYSQLLQGCADLEEGLKGLTDIFGEIL